MKKSSIAHTEWARRNREHVNTYARARYAANPEGCREAARGFRKRNQTVVRARDNARYARRSAEDKLKHRLRSAYDMSVDDYEKLLSQQGGVCALCRSDPKTGRLVVDRCHKTHRIRGLLCTLCNIALGCLRENPDTIKRISGYLNTVDGAWRLRGK